MEIYSFEKRRRGARELAVLSVKMEMKTKFYIKHEKIRSKITLFLSSINIKTFTKEKNLCTVPNYKFNSVYITYILYSNFYTNFFFVQSFKNTSFI